MDSNKLVLIVEAIIQKKVFFLYCTVSNLLKEYKNDNELRGDFVQGLAGILETYDFDEKERSEIQFNLENTFANLIVHVKDDNFDQIKDVLGQFNYNRVETDYSIDYENVEQFNAYHKAIEEKIAHYKNILKETINLDKIISYKIEEYSKLVKQLQQLDQDKKLRKNKYSDISTNPNPNLNLNLNLTEELCAKKIAEIEEYRFLSVSKDMSINALKCDLVQLKSEIERIENENYQLKETIRDLEQKNIETYKLYRDRSRTDMGSSGEIDTGSIKYNILSRQCFNFNAGAETSPLLGPGQPNNMMERSTIYSAETLTGYLVDVDVDVDVPLTKEIEKNPNKIQYSGCCWGCCDSVGCVIL
jgi:hypothetical protein